MSPSAAGADVVAIVTRTILCIKFVGVYLFKSNRIVLSRQLIKGVQLKIKYPYRRPKYVDICSKYILLVIINAFVNAMFIFNKKSLLFCQRY